MIDKIRSLIEELDIKAYTPELPQEESNVCAVTRLGGTHVNCINNKVLYKEMNGRVIFRGTENDDQTFLKTNEIIQKLHLSRNISYSGGKIINIICSLPTYVGKDENQRILYNITFTSKYEEVS